MYICLICKKTKKKTLFTKTVKRKKGFGKIEKVPVCCGHKMHKVKK